MKRLLAFVAMVIGLGMMLSGCTIGSHYIKESYIEKNYIDKVKVPESKKVGDRNIKFYVGKVVDKRKDKYVWMKLTSFLIPAGEIHFEDICGTLKHITEKALYNTGWGVVDNRSKADFIVDTVINYFKVHRGFIINKYRVKTNVCFLNKANRVVLIKQIYKERPVRLSDGPIIDLTGRLKYAVGIISNVYYKALLDYFSSPAFKNAIEKAYAQEVNDDSTISH